MSHLPFSDKRACTLLSRVSDDLSHLRHDISTLFGHTKKHTLPEGARELAEAAREHLAAGKSYAASQFRHLRSQKVEPTTGIIAGAALLGLIGLGVYALCKHQCTRCADEYDPEEELDA